ncbi:MAG: TetR/AcrR family transcriptional regulator [Syntrophomonadaceae bacterium]|nr:TetR/AcrR family transcriptional regulator [Syntrophomonadaceae bacterium]
MKKDQLDSSADRSREPRLRILETAEALFASRGFEGVSIREIADQAKVNSAMIYYYFGNKTGLYRGIIEKALAELTDRLTLALQEGKNPVERLTRYLNSHIAFLRLKSRTAQIIFQVIYSSDTQVDLLVDQYWSQHFLMVEQILKDGIAAGCFRRVDTRLATISLRGMILWYFMAAPIVSRYPGMEGYPQQFDDQLAEHTLDLFLQGLMRRD